MRAMNLAQRFDPRTKIILVVVISTLSVVITDPLWLFGLFALSLALLCLSGMRLLEVFSRLRRFLFLFAALLVIQSIFTSTGEPLITIGEITLVTTGGVLRGTAVVLRMLTVISSALLLLSSQPMDLVLGLIRLRVPYEIAYMVLLAIRFLPVLGEEVKDALTAIQLRGVNINKIPLGRKVRVYTYIFMPVVVSALMKARQTAMVMEARAFRAYPRRTYLDELILKPADYAVMTAALLAGAGLCSIYFLGR